jgi:hypothetical protein
MNTAGERVRIIQPVIGLFVVQVYVNPGWKDVAHAANMCMAEMCKVDLAAAIDEALRAQKAEMGRLMERI